MSTTWRHQPGYNMVPVHVLPVNDLREHEETDACWCAPRVETAKCELGCCLGTVIIHSALDGRELIERHGVQ